MRKELAFLIPYVKRYKGDLVQGVLALVVASLFSAAVPYLIKLAVDSLQSGFGRRVIHIIMITGALVLIQAALKYRSRTKILNTSREIEFELRRDFYAHLIALPYGFFREHHRGDLIARMMNDIGNIRMMVGMVILHFSSTVTTTVLSLAMMFKLNATITLLAVFPLCFLFLVIRRFIRKLHHIFVEIQDANGRLSRGVNEVLSGIRVIKNYVLQEAEQKRFDGLNRDYMEKSLAATRIWGLVFPSMGFLGGVGTLLVMWIGGYFLMQGRITLGDFIALNTYYMALMWPIVALGWVLNLYQRGVASLKRIETIYEYAAEKDEGIIPPLVRGELTFDGINVIKGDRTILNNVSFTLKPGEKLLVIGPTGSGKSTMLNLVLGLEQDYQGSIRLDGVDVREIALPVTRRKAALVPQDPFLYSLSIRENIFSPQEIERLVHMVGMKEEVERFDQGVDTVVGERGVTLSGGQKQRLTLARALAVKPEILLLDDPFTHVDGYTEHQIWERVWPALKDMTVIITSSRPVPINKISRAMVLVNGAIADYGTPEELLDRNAYMKLLYEVKAVAYG